MPTCVEIIHSIPCTYTASVCIHHSMHPHLSRGAVCFFINQMQFLLLHQEHHPAETGWHPKAGSDSHTSIWIAITALSLVSASLVRVRAICSLIFNFAVYNTITVSYNISYFTCADICNGWSKYASDAQRASLASNIASQQILILCTYQHVSLLPMLSTTLRHSVSYQPFSMLPAE